MTGIIDRLRAMQGMGDIQLKALMDGVGPQAADEIERLAARLEATEEDRARFLVEMGRLCAQCDALRAKIEAMEKQEPVAKVRVHQTGGNAGIAWSVAPLNDFDALPLMRDGSKLYALPGAQPAPSVPRESIERMLTQLMDIAVSNGANSISMPDEYVEVAAWLCGIPAQPAPNTPTEQCSQQHQEAKP